MTRHPDNKLSKNGPPAGLMGWPVAVIMSAAVAVVLPFLYWGNPSGHDFEFHMNSWMEVLRQWKEGVIYPSWAGLAHYGYGEPIFIFYPPISWMMGGFLSAFLPWLLVPAAYIWIALTLSGCSMFWLCRIWLDRDDAIYAAVFYIVNPYYLIVVYWRSAFAELLGGALFPLVALFLWRTSEGRRMVIPLALVVSAAWLTDVPAAVMLTYSLGLLAVVFSTTLRSYRIAGAGISAVIVAAAMAAFYLLPAIYEQKWINIGQVLAPGVRPIDNFLFTYVGDSDHDHFNLFVSLIAFSEIVGLLGCIVLIRRQNRSGAIWRAITLWGFTCVLIMFPFSLFAWKYFPELKFVQLPWRWLLCVNLVLAFFWTSAWHRWRSRLVLYGVFLAVLICAGIRVQQPWWDRASDIAEMADDQASGHGYEGTDEYVPAATDGYDISQSAPLVSASESSPAQVQMEQWNAQGRRFTVTASIPAKVSLRLFNYPSWKVEINGKETPAETNSKTGQMVIRTKPGVSHVVVTLRRTWDRTVGALISVSTGIIILAGIIFKWRGRSPRLVE